MIAWLGAIGILIAVPPWYQTNGWPGTVVARGFHSNLLNPMLSGPRRHSSQLHFDWLVFFAEAIGITAIACLVYWRVGRPKPGFCPRCEYDLRGTPSRCPECGWESPRQQPQLTGDAHDG